MYVTRSPAILDLWAAFSLLTAEFPLDCNSIRVRNDPNALSVTGFIVDIISELTPCITWESISTTRSLVRTVKDLFSFLEAATACSGSSMNDDVLGAFLTAGRGSNIAASGEDWVDVSKWVDCIKQKGNPGQTWAKTLQDQLEDGFGRVISFHKRFEVACLYRHAFATTSALVGLGPRHMLVGDVAAIRYGCRWPVVLQPENWHYLVVGVCSVQGIMFDEAVRRHRADGAEDETFIIR